MPLVVGRPPRALAVLLVFVSLTFAGCVDDPTMDPATRRSADWQAEAAREAPFGVPAQVALAEDWQDGAEGYTFRTTCDDVRWEDGFVVGGVGAGGLREEALFLEDADVAGHGRGVVALVGGAIRFADGEAVVNVTGWAAGGDDPSTLRISSEMGADTGTSAERWAGWGEYANASATWQRAHDAYWFRDRLLGNLTDFVVSGHERALLIVDGNETPLPAEFEASATWLSGGPGTWFTPLDEGLLPTGPCRYAATASGEDESGPSEVFVVTFTDASPFEESRVATGAVFGHDGAFALGADGFAPTATARLTQYATEEGYGLDAVVQVGQLPGPVRIRAGDSTWVHTAYREASFVGDAVLSDVHMVGDIEGMVLVPLDAPPSLVREIMEMAGGTGVVAPLFVLAVAPALPFVAMFDGLRCLFSVCAEGAYPGWMDAGSAGVFSVQVDASEAQPGTYVGEVVFVGENHREAVLQMEIIVEE